MSLNNEEDDYYADADDVPACNTCRGIGTVNPLTAPNGFFCVGTTECPHCDGSGELQ